MCVCELCEFPAREMWGRGLGVAGLCVGGALLAELSAVSRVGWS